VNKKKKKKKKDDREEKRNLCKCINTAILYMQG